MVKRILLLILHKTDFCNRRLVCFILFCTIPVSLAAQIVRMPLTAAYLQVDSYSSKQNDPFSFQTNQASLATIKNFSAGIYSERRFMMKELASYKSCLSFPTSGGNFGLNGGYAGNQYYNESQLGLAYGRRLGKLDLGVQFNYFQLKTQGYGNAASVNFEAGVMLKITEKVNIGVHVYNPTASRIGKNNEERLPAIFSTGFGYDVSEQFFMGCRVEKTEDQPVDINAGMQYCFADRLFAKMGITTATGTFYFGAGFLMNHFRIDVTSAWHPQLGLSPGFLLIYHGAEK
jgi:hypothetical protein